MSRFKYINESAFYIDTWGRCQSAIHGCSLLYPALHLKICQIATIHEGTPIQVLMIATLSPVERPPPEFEELVVVSVTI